MQTTIKQITPVEYEFHIEATAQDLAPKINKRLRDQRAGISLKGFRKGKVPLSILKKMFGESLVIDVLERSILDVFQDEVIEPGEHRIVGLPSFGEFDYKLDGDLHATLKFGVHPNIEFKDVSGEKILKLVHEVTEEEIDQEIKQIRMRDADLSTREEGGIEESDYVTIDMQRLDPGTNAPVIGEREEDISFFMDDEQLKDALRAGLLGKNAEDSFRVLLPIEETDEDEDELSSDLLVLPGKGEDVARIPYQVLVKEVKSRSLPELDEEFIKQVTREKAEDETGLRDFVRKRIEDSYAEESRKLLESELMTRMLELHDFPVPESAIDVFINSFLEEIKSQNENKLPEGFDMGAFKEANREYAEKQARWKLMRDALIEREGLEVTDEDRTAYFLELTDGDEETAGNFERYYMNMKGMMDMINERLLSQKLFAYLSEQVALDEKDKDAYLDAMKERNAKRDALKIS